MAKIVTMGEIMLRLSTPGNEKFIQADEFDINYGGSEANVAVSLANYGYDTEYVSAIPDNPIGDCAVAALRKYNVGTKYISRSGDRLGIYYLEPGSSVRPSNIVYDRAGSSIACATADLFDFDAIFADADWFHFTGITPALSDSAAALTEAALKAARAHGVTVSVDLNFRKKLWSQEKAREVMTNLMQYVDVCIGNEEDAEKVLGFKPEGSDVMSGNLELAGYMNIFSQIGVIMLIGLVSKNGILIVEFANQKQEAGEDKMQAIRDAALQRLRPILMTSASTILGLLPLAFASGEGSNQRIAMGVAVVGGMLVSTFLTMYIVPAIYSYISTNRAKKERK